VAVRDFSSNESVFVVIGMVGADLGVGQYSDDLGGLFGRQLEPSVSKHMPTVGSLHKQHDQRQNDSRSGEN
jgi:hypothetical protein